ncbi:MAG: hypothetical protein Q9163_002931, partial [Psora crenata]
MPGEYDRHISFLVVGKNTSATWILIAAVRVGWTGLVWKAAKIAKDGGCYDRRASVFSVIVRRCVKGVHQVFFLLIPDDPLVTAVAQNSPEAHIALLEKYLKVAQHLSDVDEKLVSSNLWHTDLHASNLFDLEDKQKTKIKQQISNSTLYQLYLIETEEKNPRLFELFHLDHGKTRRLAVNFAKDTWDDDIVAFREALINAERYWKELGVSGAYPIYFTEDDLNSYSYDAEEWNDVQDFFDSIQDLVQRDGWTRNKTFDNALTLFTKLRKTGLRDLKGKERELFEKQTRWAEKGDEISPRIEEHKSYGL